MVTSTKKDYSHAWIAIQKYCAYQERCHREVKQKLYDYGLRTDEVDELMMRLIEDNFLNEERFAISYAGGKFRVKKWGRNKILQELKRREISDYCIRKGMLEIDDDEYIKSLRSLLDKKYREYKGKNSFELNGKVARYCIAKGYEPDLVWEEIKSRQEA